MRKILAGVAILGMSSTAALACPMSGGYSAAVDRELVVASVETDTQEVEIAQMSLPVQDEAEVAAE